jgi:hypothetical protein
MGDGKVPFALDIRCSDNVNFMEGLNAVEGISMPKCTQERKAYSRPTLEEIGKVGNVTLANGAQNAIDQDFPDNTNFNDLTFS